MAVARMKLFIYSYFERICFGENLTPLYQRRLVSGFHLLDSSEKLHLVPGFRRNNVYLPPESLKLGN
jgi:hypothetical protein